MTTTFPSLCPTSRQYQPGEYPTQRFNSISGAGTTRLYGSKPYDATLNVDFNVTDSELIKIMDCWAGARGSASVLTLPDSLFQGMAAGLRSEIQGSLNWRWAQRPSVTSLFPGRSTVQAQFIATLDNS